MIFRLSAERRTCLNVNEQLTVNAPLGALHTYFFLRLDVLYLSNCRLSKQILRRLGSE